MKEKFQPKVPPHHLYCPICGDKAGISRDVFTRASDCSEITIHKYCDKCGANWDVRYYLKPKAITNIVVCSEYEDIAL